MLQVDRLSWDVPQAVPWCASALPRGEGRLLPARLDPGARLVDAEGRPVADVLVERVEPWERPIACGRTDACGHFGVPDRYGTPRFFDACPPEEGFDGPVDLDLSEPGALLLRLVRPDGTP